MDYLFTSQCARSRANLPSTPCLLRVAGGLLGFGGRQILWSWKEEISDHLDSWRQPIWDSVGPLTLG
jgi:hypothetical protein